MEVHRDGGRFTDRPVTAALAGAIVGIVLFFVPGSTLLGGAIAGYLAGSGRRRGTAVGAFAGVLMYLPLPIIVIGLGTTLPVVSTAGGLFTGLWVALFAYTVGMGALGGYVGAYLNATPTDARLRTTGREATAGSTIIHGVLGGIVGVVLAFIPYSTVLGGAAAGYLEGGTLWDGAVVGAIAGFVALVPFIVLAVVAIGVLGFLGGLAGIAIGAVIVLLLAGGLLYVLGLSILGGVLGAYIRVEIA